MENKKPEGGARARSIGATIMTTATIAGYIGQSVGILKRMWVWGKRLFGKAPEPRTLYFWRIGNDEYPAGGGEILKVIEEIEKMGHRESSLVTHHAVCVHELRLHEHPAWVWTVGNTEYPAGPTEIENLAKLLGVVAEDESVNAIVTHHLVGVSPISANKFKAARLPDDKEIQLTKESTALVRNHEETSGTE